MKVHSQLELPKALKGKLRSFHLVQVPLCSYSAALSLIGSYPFHMTTSVSCENCTFAFSHVTYELVFQIISDLDFVAFNTVHIV